MEQTARSSLPTSPERAWVVTAVVAALALVVGSFTFTRQVWDGFLWHYFWGPIYADANNAVCAVKSGGAPELLGSTSACTQANAAGRIVAEPGYTVVSEIGYAVTLVFFLVGVLFLLRRLDVGRDRSLFFALVPFMFFGGALRVVEDANDAALRATGEFLIPYPLNTLIISPLIYFTVFVITLAALLAAIVVVDRKSDTVYARVMLYAGAGVLTLTVGFLALLSLTTTYVGAYPQILAVVLGGSAVISYGVYRGLKRYAPAVTAGVGSMGLVVLFAHTVDGLANVVALDWAVALGLDANYTGKHPVNRFIIDVTGSYLPDSLLATFGEAWPFLIVKIVAATAVLYVFDETVFEENPRYAILLLVAIVAVGLGPGTRDMLRAAFGI